MEIGYKIAKPVAHQEVPMAEGSQELGGVSRGRQSQAPRSAKAASGRLGTGDFSPNGLAEFKKATDNYVMALEQACQAIARRRRSDQVSEYEVRLATDVLDTRRTGRTERIREIGILLIGAGLSYLTVMVFGSSYTFRNALITFVPLLFGSIAYAYSWGQAR